MRDHVAGLQCCKPDGHDGSCMTSVEVSLLEQSAALRARVAELERDEVLRDNALLEFSRVEAERDVLRARVEAAERERDRLLRLTHRWPCDVVRRPGSGHPCTCGTPTSEDWERMLTQEQEKFRAETLRTSEVIQQRDAALRRAEEAEKQRDALKAALTKIAGTWCDADHDPCPVDIARVALEGT